MSEKIDGIDGEEREKFVTRRLVAKIGSSAITEGATNDEPLNKGLIDSIARQCSELFENGVEIAVPSSGSVACGRQVLHLKEDDIVDRQVEAAYGQPYLIKTWIEAFAKYGVKAAQVLLTEADLNGAKLLLNRAMKHGVVIINENDSVSDQEMRQFLVSADNDRLAGFVAAAIGADTLLILTDVKGVLDSEGNLVEDGNSVNIEGLLGKSDKGTGGMKSKVEVARQAAENGMSAYIAQAKRPDIILSVARGRADGICTSFAKGGVSDGNN